MNEDNTQAKNNPSSPVITAESTLDHNRKTGIQLHLIFAYFTFILFIISILIAFFLTKNAQQKPQIKTPIEKQNTVTNSPPPFSESTLNVSSYPTSHRSPDNSYIIFAIDKGVNLTVKNQYGESVGQTYDDHATNDATKQYSPSIPKPTLIIFEYVKPESGEYTIELSSETTKSFQLDGTFITKDADTKKETIKGTLNPKIKKIFLLSYDKQIAEKAHIIAR